MANSMSSVRNVEMAPNSTVARSGGSRVFLTLLLWLFLGWSTVMAKRVGAARRAGPTSHEKRELWLVDYTKDHLYEMQADGVGRGARTSVPQCPPPPRQRPHHACRVAPCRSDKECLTAGDRCCNNGCAFTCMATMPPPPVVDWRREPEKSDRVKQAPVVPQPGGVYANAIISGISWLLKNEDSDTEDKFQVESCSTSVLTDDEDALLCPHGYLCHIEYLGDAENGIPNRGRCIPDVRDHKEETHRIFRVKTQVTAGGCIVESRKYTDGASFTYERHQCTCHAGTVTCRVGRRHPRREASRNT